MRLTRWVPLLLLLAVSLEGAEPKAVIKGPKSAYVDWPITLRFNGTISDRPIRIYLAEGPEKPEEVDFIRFADKKGTLTHVMAVPGKPGVYRFALVAEGVIQGEEFPEIAVATHDVRVIDPFNPAPAPTPTPPPLPPVDPIPPIPIPTPPPDPDPGPTPIPAPVDPVESTVRVLLLHESSKPMTRKQENIWYSGLLTEFLNTATTSDSSGRGGWRRWDVDVKVVKEAPEWQEMMDAARGLLEQPNAPQLPVIVVFRGKAGKAYPFPEDENLLRQIVKGSK